MLRSLSFSFAFIIALSSLGLISPGTLQAKEQQSVTLQVENMTCAACPFTVKKALRQIDGVQQVSAKYEGSGKGWVRVTFNSDKTNVDDLIKATTEAGYPSHL